MTRFRSILALCTALILTVGFATTAHAAPSEAEELAELSAAVNPDQSAVAEFESIDSGASAATQADADQAPIVEVVAEGETQVGFSLPGADTPYLEITVAESDAHQVVASSGLAVAPAASSDAPSVVVAATEEGTSIQAVLDSPTVDPEVRFEFSATELRFVEGGAVEAIMTDARAPGLELMLARVEAPWAFDADGIAVETWYEIDGTTLVQHVEVGPETAYPVIADPYQYNGLSHPQIRWNWTETKQLNANKGNYFYIAAACGGLFFFAPVAALIAAVGCGTLIAHWANGIGNAYGASRCFAVNVTWTLAPTSYACLKR